MSHISSCGVGSTCSFLGACFISTRNNPVKMVVCIKHTTACTIYFDNIYVHSLRFPMYSRFSIGLSLHTSCIVLNKPIHIPEQASANIIDCVESYILKTSFFATTFNKRAIINGCNKSNKSLCLSLKTSSKYLFVRTPSCFNGDVFFPESFIMSDIFSFSFTSGISVFLSRCCSL